MATLSDKVTVPIQVMTRELEHQVVILDLESGTYFGLDQVGASIWNGLCIGQDLSQICDTLNTTYDVSRQTLERDMLKLVDELLAKGLLERA